MRTLTKLPMLIDFYELDLSSIDKAFYPQRKKKKKKKESPEASICLADDT